MVVIFSKVAAITQRDNTLTCNKSQMPQILGHLSTESYCWPSQMAAITSNKKVAAITHRVNIGNRNKNQTTLSLFQSSTETCCLHYWMVVILNIIEMVAMAIPFMSVCYH